VELDALLACESGCIGVSLSWSGIAFWRFLWRV
jgi:hypothetical protein